MAHRAIREEIASVFFKPERCGSHLPNKAASRTVSGKRRPLVSGKKKTMIAVKMPATPNTIWGRAGPNVPLTYVL